MTRTLAILEAVVDIVAIIGLVVLAVFHVVDGSTVLPLITLVAGGSIGARVAKRSRLPRRKTDEEGGEGGAGSGEAENESLNHVSLLAMAFLPLLHLVADQAARAIAIRTAALAFVAYVVSSLMS